MLDCGSNKLASLPELPNCLEMLDCRYNEFTNFNCDGNKLTHLPHLNETITFLSCENNELRYLPELNNKLDCVKISKNPICHILYSSIITTEEDEDDGIDFLNINIIKSKFKILHNFRCLYYSLKFKSKFRDWLWIRVREKRIKQDFHPSKIFELLKHDDADDIDGEILNL